MLFVILILSSCHSAKARLVDRKRLAKDEMGDDHALMGNITSQFRNGSISGDKFEKEDSSYFMDSCRWQHVYDSCQDELEKF